MGRGSWTLGVVGVAAAIGGWMALSPVHGHQNADSIVPVLVSLWRWTFFYWEQDRFGMLLPLLASPFAQPFHNLVVQVALRFAALALACFLLARAVLPRPYWPAAGALVLAALVVAKDLPFLAFVQMQPYGPAAALALGALPLLEGRGAWRLAGGALLLLLASWVAVSTLLWLLPLLIVRAALGLDGPPARPAAARLLPAATALAAGGASMIATGVSRHPATDLSPAAMVAWPRGWATLAGNLVELLGPGMLAAAPAAVALAALVAWRGSARARLAAAAGGALLAIATAELLALGASGWVHRNAFRPRFQLVGALAIAMAPLAVAVVLALEGRRAVWHRAANVAALLLLLPLTLWRFGPPSPAAARQAVERLPGSSARAVLAAGGSHVIGDYWQVWPTVFHANLLLAEAGDSRRVWGIAYRAGPTADLWRPADWCTARIAVVGSAVEAERARRRYRVPLVTAACAAQRR